MSDRIAIRMMVGAHLDEVNEGRVRPLVVGCIDHSTWEIESPEDTDARWHAMQENFTGEASNYVWREIEVAFEVDELRKHLIVPEVEGSVIEPVAGLDTEQ